MLAFLAWSDLHMTWESSGYSRCNRRSGAIAERDPVAGRSQRVGVLAAMAASGSSTSRSRPTALLEIIACAGKVERVHRSDEDVGRAALESGNTTFGFDGQGNIVGARWPRADRS